MSITSAESAQAWIRAWGGSVRLGILKEVLRGDRGARLIMDADRYSDKDRQDMDGAIEVLEAHLVAQVEKSEEYERSKKTKQEGKRLALNAFFEKRCGHAGPW